MKIDLKKLAENLPKLTSTDFIEAETAITNGGNVLIDARYHSGLQARLAAKALDMAGRIERVPVSTLRITLGYNAVGNITRLLEGAGALGMTWNYGENVNVSCDVPVSECGRIEGELVELEARGIISSWEKISS